MKLLQKSNRRGIIYRDSMENQRIAECGFGIAE
jgi:hypothetical protein